jgi:hypothetical protein
MHRQHRQGRSRQRWLSCSLGALWLVTGGAAQAFAPVEFSNGAVLDVSAQLSYVNMKRLRAPDAHLMDMGSPIAINMDDGDRSVGRHGSISHRIGALVDLNLSRDNYRMFVRSSSFYDAAIDRNSANGTQATFNSALPSNQFGAEVRSLIGGRTRLLDAYAQGRWELGEAPGQAAQYPLTVRVGRQVVAWGEGLYFMGIGGAMNPQDAYKAQIPGTPVKELFLPSEQISATLGVGERWMLMAYSKWAFRETEVMPVGSYFSPTDMLGAGSSFMRLAAGNPMAGAWREPDAGRKSGGQWGLGAKYQLTDASDVGVYHLRYHDMAGLPEFRYGSDFWLLGVGPLSLPALAGVAPSAFRTRYMNDIRLTGASFSTRLGETNVAGELVRREGAPVMLADSRYQLARARVTNAQVSLIHLWGSDFLRGMLGVDTAQLSGEVAASRAHGFDTPWASAVPMAPATLKFDRNSLAYTLGLALKYTAVRPGWDLAVPLDWSHQLHGNPGLQGWNSGLQGENDRRVALGVTLTYQQNLSLGLRLVHFLGKADVRDHGLRTLVDRDFIALTASCYF